MTMYNFEDQYRIGEQGVLLLEEYLHWRCPSSLIERPSESADRCGVDLIMTDADGLRHLIQVKYDFLMQKTGNIFAETIRDEARGAEGWIYRCKAEELYYINAVSGVATVAAMNAVRAAFYSRWQCWPRHLVKNESRDKKFHWFALGVLVPQEEFARHTHAQLLDLNIK